MSFGRIPVGKTATKNLEQRAIRLPSFSPFPDFSLSFSLLFQSAEHAFCLQPSDYYSFQERDLLFILEIISLRWRERKLYVCDTSSRWRWMENNISLWKGHFGGYFVFSLPKYLVRVALCLFLILQSLTVSGAGDFISVFQFWSMPYCNNPLNIFFGWKL